VSMPSDREVLMTRDFDAPRRLVWDAMSRPEFLKRWLTGPPGWTMTICEDDNRVGGTFRWVWRGPDGNELTMRGVYRELVPPERVVRTESFEMGGAPPMGEQLVTLELAEKGDKTKLTIRLSYDSREARDGAMASGMEQGMNHSYANLDELLAAELAASGK
jgi:uncharacterized protein YndB with AHSA1/START domain